jgi:hypothetical protein
MHSRVQFCQRPAGHNQEILNRSADAHEWQVLNAAVDPFYENMQNSPEFRTLKRLHWARTLNGCPVCRLEPRGAQECVNA